MMTQIPISVCRNSGDHSGAHLKPDYNNARDAEAGDISLNVDGRSENQYNDINTSCILTPVRGEGGGALGAH